MDELTVKVERRVDLETARVAEAAAELKRLIKINIGSSCTIDVVDPGGLERSIGKMRRIYDLRQK
jgi:phenylacetate-CoA ligase